MRRQKTESSGTSQRANPLKAAARLVGFTAPDFVLASRNAFAKTEFAGVSDLSEQVRDIGFTIDCLLGHPEKALLVDFEALSALPAIFMVLGPDFLRSSAQARAMRSSSFSTAISRLMRLHGQI